MLMNAQSATAVSIPPFIRESPLMRAKGFTILDGLVAPTTLKMLLSEAVELYQAASDNKVLVSDGFEGRGGSPARSFFSASGGPVQDALYSAPDLLDYLRKLTGTDVSLSGGRGTYSYYTRPGDYLALHRDVESCDLTLITTLHDRLGPESEGGALCLYPDRILEPLSAIRGAPEQGAVKKRMQPGQTLAFYGGIVPHALLPVVADQHRIVSILCFRVGPRQAL